MPLNTNPFIEGIDPTSTFGGYASVLLQLIREAKPSSTYGMILFDTTAPDVTGANAWRKTCVWLDLTNPNIPTVNVYREGGSPGWVNVNNIIGNGAIVNAMIANLAVTIAKLSPAGGTANQLIRVNAGATAFEFVSLSSLVTTGSIPITSLITTSIPAGELRFAGAFGPGTAIWYTPISLINALPDASIPTDLLGPAPAATSRSQFLTTRLGDPFGTWRYFDPTNDLQANALNGNRLTNNTVALSKIIPASADAVMVTQGGVVDWVPASTLTGSITQFVTDVGSLGTYVDTAGSSTTLNHTLGAMPLMFRVVLRCESSDANYVNGDEIDAQELALDSSSDFSTAFMFYVTSTFVKVTKTYGGHVVIRDKTSGAYHAINLPNKWRLRLYAMKVN
jgi:hypothetical protein